MWKKFRVIILLMILMVVAINAWRDKNQDWSQPIFVALYPINADNSLISEHYIQTLNEQDLQRIADYLQQQSVAYGRTTPRFYFRLGQKIQQLPPVVPAHGSMLEVILWSLKFRYYAWQQRQNMGFSPSVELFLSYYDPQTHPVLKHSTALENGRIGIVNLFASQKQAEQNQIVIAHELLHAFGATDKYELATGQPLYPLGYANPQQQPLYPQKKAELMAVAIALSSDKNKMAENLDQTVINQQTATEIGWLKQQ